MDLRASGDVRQNRRWKHRAQYQHARAANESELMVFPDEAAQREPVSLPEPFILGLAANPLALRWFRPGDQ
jgi:hypothetical protein